MSHRDEVVSLPAPSSFLRPLTPRSSGPGASDASTRPLSVRVRRQDET